MTRANEFTYYFSKTLALGGSTGFDAGYDNSLNAAVTEDTTQTLTVTTQTLTGELVSTPGIGSAPAATSMNIVVVPYGSFAPPDAVYYNVQPQFPYGQTFMEYSVFGRNWYGVAGSQKSLTRCVIRDNSGHMLYIFDISPSPLIVTFGTFFKIHLRHPFAGT